MDIPLNDGDTAWVLVSSALVLLMTPGLALFYGGMVRSKSVLNMMMMSFGSMASVTVIWALWGFSMTFGNSQGGLVGDPFEFFGLKGMFGERLFGTPEGGGIPAMAFVAFQAMFAIITVALISGAIADRAKFGTWMIFSAIWATLVYFPVAHWVFSFDGYVSEAGGWIANSLGAIDFAGGTAVHINAGAAGLALALVLGKRVGFAKEPMRPHNLTLVMIGAGLLWFGWFGFNAGSALGANGLASITFVNTLVATAAAALGWLITERIRDGHATSLGAASGIVAGLVAITPACSALTPLGSIALGAISGVLCALAVSLKFTFGFDDSLDVVGVHLVGGLVGTIGVGFLADPGAPAGAAGLFFGGGVEVLGKQTIGALVVLAYSFIVTAIIGLALDKTIGFRLDKDAEVAGIDLAQHAETGYDLGGLGSARVGGMSAGASSSAPSTSMTGQRA